MYEYLDILHELNIIDIWSNSLIRDNTALGMSGKLENAEHSEHSEGDEGATDFAVVCHQEADVVGHDGHEVYH